MWRCLAKFGGPLQFGFREPATQVCHLECEWNVRQYGTGPHTQQKHEQPEEATIHVVPLPQTEARASAFDRESLAR